MRIAVECFADFTLLEFLRDTCGIRALTDHHAHSQGEVIKAVFEKGRADAGIVDEDPGKSHHKLRDRTTLVRPGIDVDVQRLEGRFLFVVKPNLEVCFFRAMTRTKQSSWFKDASQMHRILGVSSSREHPRFKEELRLLRDAGAKRNVPTFLSELEQGLKEIVASG